jgi:hypothetical protein
MDLTVVPSVLGAGRISFSSRTSETRACPGAPQDLPESAGQFLDLAVGDAIQSERDQVNQLVRHLDLSLNRLPFGPILRPLHPKFDQTGCQPQKKIVGYVAVLPIPVRLSVIGSRQPGVHEGEQSRKHHLGELSLADDLFVRELLPVELVPVEFAGLFEEVTSSRQSCRP